MTVGDTKPTLTFAGRATLAKYNEIRPNLVKSTGNFGAALGKLAPTYFLQTNGAKVHRLCIYVHIHAYRAMHHVHIASKGLRKLRRR